MDLTTLTDDDLDALRVQVLNERERRQRLASIPVTVAQLAAQYIEGGGDLSALEAAIAPPMS